MRVLYPLYIAIAVIVAAIIAIFALATLASAAPFVTGVGGTGSTTPSGILYGDNGATTHLNTVLIGAGCTFSGGTLTCSGTASAGAVATSTHEVTNDLPLWTSTSGTPATLGQVAASTNGFVLALVGGVPTWVATSSINNGVTSITVPQGTFNGVLTFATTSNTTNGITSSLTITGSGSTLTFGSNQSGVLTVAGGGTGAATLTGCLTGNGTGAITGSGTCNTSNASVSSISNGGGLDFSVSPITTTGTITAQLATGTIPVAGRLAGFMGPIGTPTSLYDVATSSTSFSTAGFSTTGTIGNFVGGAASTIKQFENRSFSYATTTWTGTTTLNLESGYGELWNYAQCWTVPNGSTLNVDFYFHNNNTAHLDFINASSTAGREIFTTNNTITNNASTSVDIGKPASSPTAITCTVNDAI